MYKYRRKNLSRTNEYWLAYEAYSVFVNRYPLDVNLYKFMCIWLILAEFADRSIWDYGVAWTFFFLKMFQQKIPLVEWMAAKCIPNGS